MSPSSRKCENHDVSQPNGPPQVITGIHFLLLSCNTLRLPAANIFWFCWNFGFILNENIIRNLFTKAVWTITICVLCNWIHLMDLKQIISSQITFAFILHCSEGDIFLVFCYRLSASLRMWHVVDKTRQSMCEQTFQRNVPTSSSGSNISRTMLYILPCFLLYTSSLLKSFSTLKMEVIRSSDTSIHI